MTLKLMRATPAMIAKIIEGRYDLVVGTGLGGAGVLVGGLSVVL